jgi:hypothetical protein
MEICGTCQEIVAVKNKEYGSSFRDVGVLGSVLDINRKNARLRRLVVRNPTHGRDKQEQILDTLQDLHNHVAFAIMMLKENNWEGID